MSTEISWKDIFAVFCQPKKSQNTKRCGHVPCP